MVRPFGSESNLFLTVTASVFLSELVGPSNHNGSSGDEKADAPPGLALNLMTLYKGKSWPRPAAPSLAPTVLPRLPRIPSSSVRCVSAEDNTGASQVARTLSSSWLVHGKMALVMIYILFIGQVM